MENIINPHNELAMPKRNLPRDVFLHLLAVVTLYWSAVSFITLCWQYVNYWFPDALSYNYGFNGNMRFAMSSLFIVFPVFIVVSWLLNKIYAKEAEVRESKVRKWLIYLTLFVTALIIIGDLIFVINSFLGGETTLSFILKALSVLIVAVAIFWYYLDDVRRDTPSRFAKYFAIDSSIIVAAGLIGAFFIVGSPMNARLAQFDQQRVYGLQNIQGQVVNYWQQKGELPTTLADLNDSISGYIAPVDPKTNQAYEYNLKDAVALNFELCATFDLASTIQPSAKTMPAYPVYLGEVSQNWDHGQGRVCFERIIDSQFYPPVLNK